MQFHFKAQLIFKCFECKEKFYSQQSFEKHFKKVHIKSRLSERLHNDNSDYRQGENKTDDNLIIIEKKKFIESKTVETTKQEGYFPANPKFQCAHCDEVFADKKLTMQHLHQVN